MRIDALRLVAFGAFEGRTLDLSAGGEGLHVVFGPNEAGKSTALRAIETALYGFPARTTDDFRHGYDRLRVGATLRLRSGATIEFVRRKGNRATIRTPDDAALPDDALAPFLGGADRETFRRFWGIDHGRLVEGGHELLAGKGELGESLFAAGMGLSNLARLRAALRKETDAIWTARAQNPPLNAALRAWRESGKALREATVSADDWDRRRTRLDAARSGETTARDELRARTAEKARLERLKKVIPLLDTRRGALAELAPFADARILAPDFADRLARARAARATIVMTRDLRRAELAREREALANLGDEPPLAAETKTVAELLKALGSDRKAAEDRAKLVEQRREHLEQARRILADLGAAAAADDPEALRAVVGRQKSLRKLAAECVALDEREKESRRRKAEARHASERAAQESAALPAARDGGPLASILRDARSAGDLELAARKARDEVQRLAQECDDLVARLGLPGGAASTAAAMRVPSAQAIAAAAARETEAEAQRAARRREAERAARKIVECESSLRTFRNAGDVPTDADLTQARTRRDRSFELLVARWERGEDVTAAVRELLGEGAPADLHRAAVARADAVADALRRDADRSARLVELQSAVDAAKAERAALADAEADDARRAAEAAAAWSAAWAGLSAPSPADATAWRTDFDRLVQTAARVADAERAVADVTARTDSLRAALRRELAALAKPAPDDAGFASLVHRAQSVVEEIAAEALARTSAARHVREAADAVDAAARFDEEVRGDRAAWTTSWDAAVRDVGAEPGAAPETVLARVERLAAALALLDEAKKLQDERIAKIDRDARDFASDVRALAARVGETSALESVGPAAWIEDAQRRAGAAAAAGPRRKELTKRIAALDSEVERLDRDAVGADAAILALREESGVATEDELSEAIRRSDARRGAEKALRDVEAEIARASDGVALADLESHAAAARADLDLRIADAERLRAETEQKLVNAGRESAEAEASLRELSSKGSAAEHAEAAESHLARARGLAQDAARLRLATALLDRRVDAYRREHQAPMLRRAGEHFRTMTLDGFSSLDADVDDDGRPIVVGVRTTGEKIGADAMSEGTRDQLFLALRLAAVEGAGRASEPLPFIVDDVLVQFDDARSERTLAVLASLAKTTQVLLFTHHRRVADAARTLGESEGAFVHEL